MNASDENRPKLLDALRERETNQGGASPSLAGRIHGHLDEIVEARRAGYTFKAIHEVLEEQYDIKVNYRYFVRVCQGLTGDDTPRGESGSSDEGSRGFRTMSDPKDIMATLKKQPRK